MSTSKIVFLCYLVAWCGHCGGAPTKSPETTEGTSCLWGQSCGEDECCADNSDYTGLFYSGVCKKRATEGSICDPYTLPGGSTCPCGRGLTCALAQIFLNGTEVHRCISVLEVLDGLERYM